jgi:probable addiction module antidote protein
MKNKKSVRSYREYLIEELQDPEEAQAYLNAAFEEYESDKHLEALMLALHTVAQAQGGLSLLAKKSQINRQNLYKIFAGKRSPKWETMEAILHGLGFKLSLEPLSKN